MMRHIDILAKNANGQTVAIVEIKNAPGLTRDDARDMWQSWLKEYASLAQAPYAILVSEEVGFVWQHQKGDEQVLEFSMQPVIERYILDIQKGRRLYAQELRSLVQQWLVEIVWDQIPLTAQPEVALAEIGFIAVLKRTIIVQNATIYDSVY